MLDAVKYTVDIKKSSISSSCNIFDSRDDKTRKIQQEEKFVNNTRHDKEGECFSVDIEENKKYLMKNRYKTEKEVECLIVEGESLIKTRLFP